MKTIVYTIIAEKTRSLNPLDDYFYYRTQCFKEMIQKTLQTLHDRGASYLVLKPGVSFNEYLELSDEDTKCELIQGEFVMHSPASILHERIFRLLSFLLQGYVSHYRLGEVLGSRVAVKLSEEDTFEPDILYVSKENTSRLQENYMDGSPDIAFEILSDSTRRFDLGAKKEKYLTCGVKEYWVVDPDHQTPTLYYPDGSEMQSKAGKVTSKILQGFWLDVSWIFSLPPEKECLDQILRAPDR